MWSALKEKSIQAGKDTPVAIYSTDLSVAHEKEVFTISSVASPEPQPVAIEKDSNEPTNTY